MRDLPGSSHRAEMDGCCTTQSDGALAVGSRVSSTLATLLSNHAIRDGELIILALKPSAWFILLSSLRFTAAVLIVAIAAALADWRWGESRLPLLEATLFLIFGRLTWATLQWMGRLYVLTDLRILRVRGVFQLDVFDCPLRKVARVDLVHSTRERIFRLGTIMITPLDANMPIAQWQMVAKPRQVLTKIVDALDRYRHRDGDAIAAA